MKKEETIDKYYKEAVHGLNEVILHDKDLWYSFVVNLPIKHQIVYTVTIFHQQVFNGGFHQYFFNSYGQFAYLTFDNLKLIKAYKTANILEKAVAEVNREEYSIDEFRERIFNRKIYRITNFDDDLCNFLGTLDNEYDVLEEDIEELIYDYLEI